MTREEIKAMKPGRELDMLVAENVMGLSVIVERRPDGITWVKEDGREPYVLPSYSTDISAAWEVVKRLREEYGLRLHLELQNHSGCYIWLENDIGGNVTGCYEFESEIEGICKIALLAVMDEEDTHD
ncbi:hypothetical protein D3C72_247240 [compost metagenome]